jgi:WD40 repeat protein
MAYLVNARGTVTRLGKGGSWCIAYAEFDAVTDRLVIHRCDNTLAIIDERSEDNGRAKASRGSGPRSDKPADPERFKVTELPTGGYPAGRIATSPDGREIAAAISDRTIRLWDAASGRVIDTLRGHSDMVLDVAFSPDGSKLASASYDRTIAVWGLATGRHRVLRGHTASVTRIAWRGLMQLVTGSTDGTVRLWDVPSLELPSASEISARLNAATTAQIELDRPASSRLTHGT